MRVRPSGEATARPIGLPFTARYGNDPRVTTGASSRNWTRYPSGT
ncbi:hypothetical protein OG394_07805 [Kribbella sp. NBC_01245]|nr:hypothetical protein [Kribbella sp. NBC_01245]